MRTFLKPDSPHARATLLKYMEQVLFGLQDFLQAHLGVTGSAGLATLADRYRRTRINPLPEKTLGEVIAEIVETVAPHAVNVSSPYFVGHMTAALPFFMVHLKTLVAALNQNVVKLETSKVVSILEKQVLAQLHRLIFARSAAFYRRHVQNPATALGSFTEDGTLANLTALWVARNRLLTPGPGAPDPERDGLHAVLSHRGLERLVVLVSALGHHSLGKAAGVLGIGHANILPLPVDRRGAVVAGALERTLADLVRDRRCGILAVVGIAGTTETGSVDPLGCMADLCRRHKVHFHVDAAWGGPTVMSPRYGHLLEGIAHADSVTVDGHKQLFMPMSCGMALFRDPRNLDRVAYHARYINRPGSADLGIRSLSGSREASSLILRGALQIMGQRGYALLIDHGIVTARRFAAAIRQDPDFELTSPPQLNILTYRFRPARLRGGRGAARRERERRLDALNTALQRRQREAGRSFVSRTTLPEGMGPAAGRVVLRCVLMNPLTEIAVLQAILAEQRAIGYALLAAANF
jgi:glutamate decarboxylase